MKPKGAQVGGSVGAVGGPPSSEPLQYGEQTLAPARLKLTCPLGHKTVVSVQKVWTAAFKDKAPEWGQKARMRWSDNFGRMLPSFVPATASVADPKKWAKFGAHNLTCPKCERKLTKVEEIKGVWSAEVACNAKCIDSEGPKCSCSCGGENHGTGRMVFFEVQDTGKAINLVEVAPPAPTPAQRHPQASSLEPPPKAEQLSLFANPRRRRAP